MKRMLGIFGYIVLVLVGFWLGHAFEHREPSRFRPLPAARPAWEPDGEAFLAGGGGCVKSLYLSAVDRACNPNFHEV